MKYRIIGDAMQTVAVELSDGDSIFSSLGSMLFVRGAVSSRTSPTESHWNDIRSVIYDDKSPPIVVFRCDSGSGLVAFRVNFSGRIHPVNLDSSSRILVKRKSILCATDGIRFEPFILDGEDSGEIPSRIFVTASGSGTLFLHGRGNLIDLNLSPNERIAMDGLQVLSVDSGIILSPRPVSPPYKPDSGLFILILQATGPGRIILHTMPDLPERLSV